MHSRRLSRVQVSRVNRQNACLYSHKKAAEFFCRFLVSQIGKVDSGRLVIHVKVHSYHHYKCTYIFAIYIFMNIFNTLF